MAKRTTLLAIFTSIFVISLILSKFLPWDFGEDINQIYDKNQGRFWAVGIIIMIFWSCMFYIVGYYSIINSDLTLLLKQEIDENNNLKVTYIDQLSKLTERINDNSTRDITTLEGLTELKESVRLLHLRIEESEKRQNTNEADIKNLKSRKKKIAYD